MTVRCADIPSDLSEAVSSWFWNVWLEEASFALLPVTQEWGVLLWAGEDSSKAASSPHQAAGTWHGVAVLSLEPLEWWTKQAAPHLLLLCGLPCKAAPPWTRGVHCYPSVQPLPPHRPFPAPQSWDDGCLSHFPLLWCFLMAKTCWCCCGCWRLWGGTSLPAGVNTSHH